MNYVNDLKKLTKSVSVNVLVIYIKCLCQHEKLYDVGCIHLYIDRLFANR